MTPATSPPPDPLFPDEPPHAIPAKVRLLPPLSPLTYYRRNVWRTLPVGGAIAISVFLIAAIVTLLNSVDQSITTNYGVLRHFSVLASQFERDVPRPILEKARRLPETQRPLVSIPYFMAVKTVFGQMPVPFYGLEQRDMAVFLEATGNRVVEGRLPALNESEVALSRTWLNNFRKKVGDVLKPGEERFPSLTEPQKIVGVLEGGANVAVADKVYLQLQLPELLARPSHLFIPKKAAQMETLSQRLRDLVDKPQKFGLDKAQTRYVRVFTFSGLVGELRKSLAFLYRFLAIADVLVIGAVALLSGFLANIYFEQRLGEFGLLSALGFRRERLARRLIIESGALVLVGWLSGLLLTALLFAGLDAFYMKPHGLILAKIDQSAFIFTFPIPLIVGAASLATVLTRLYRLDPIEIMERR